MNRGSRKGAKVLISLCAFASLRERDLFPCTAVQLLLVIHRNVLNFLTLGIRCGSGDSAGLAIV
jgi:hypothetical protein